MITIVTIYLIGFFITLTFFKHFGVKLGFDYDGNTAWDDWHSNVQAYTAFGLLWFAVVPMLLMVGSLKLVFSFCKWYINK